MPWTLICNVGLAVRVAVDGWYGNLSERWFEVEKRGRRAMAPTDGGKAITKTPGNILKKQKTAERIESTGTARTTYLLLSMVEKES